MMEIDDLQKKAKEAVRDHRFQDAAELLKEAIIVSEKGQLDRDIFNQYGALYVSGKCC